MTTRTIHGLMIALTLLFWCGATVVAQTTQPAAPATTQPASTEVKKPAAPSDDEIEAAKRAVMEAEGKAAKPQPEEHPRKGTGVKPTPGTKPGAPTKPGAVPPPPQEKPVQTKNEKKGPEMPVRTTNPKPSAVIPPPAGAPKQATPTPGAKPGATPPAGAADAAPTTPASDLGETQTTIRFEVGPPNPESKTYRFDYQAMPWSDVLTDFARMSGLPFLNQPDPPLTDNMTFRSPRVMTYNEALHQLNELLLSRPVNKYLIHRQDNYLTIKRLPDLMREIPPERMFRSFEEMDSARLDDFDIVMVNLPTPKGWSCYEIIEEFRPLFSDTYGTQCKGDVIELTGIVMEHHRFREVVSKLTGMSGPQDPDSRPQRTFELKVAKATDIQNMLRQVFPATAGGAVQPGRGPGVDPKAETAKRIDIIPDVKNNKLIVIASQRALDEISQMIEKLDTGTGPAALDMRIVKLHFADANQMTMLIKQIFAREQQELISDPTVHVTPERKAAARRDCFADPGSNSVILVGTQEGLDSAEKLVREWDKPDENTVTEIVDLKNADAGAIATTITTLFPPQPKPGQQPTKIAAVTGTSLLVSASKQEFQKLKDTIAKLDVKPDDEAKQHLVKLSNATPSNLSNILTQIAPGIVPPKAPMPGRQPQPGQVGGTSLRFVPDDASGYLIVYASDREWERIEPLIKQLEEQTGIGESKLTSIKLQHANATDIVNTLKMMFPPPPQQPGKPAGAPQAAFLADEFNDAVQIYASMEFTRKVEPVIKQLDIPTKGDLTVIKLTHAKAESVAPILMQAVGASSGGPSSVVQPGQPQIAGASRGSGGGVRIVAEPITNSLLVQAPPKEMEQIHKLVTEMEEKSQTARVIVEAKNRGANELAEILKTLTSSGGGASAAVKAPGAPASPSGGMTILPSGRTIILEGPQEQVAKCLQLLDQIDMPYDQPIFRKYRVQDAEEDEKKLRAMLAMSPSGKAGGAKPAGAPGTPPPPQLAAPEAITIYADTNENTLLVGVKVEGDLKIVESFLALAFADPSVIKGGPEEGAQPFFTIALKNKDAFDIAYDVEDLVNPEGKSAGIKVDEGPNKKTLLVKNCKPSQKQLVMDVVAMYDVPKSGRITNNKRIVDCKIPPALAAKIISQNYLSADGRKVKVIGDMTAGLVPTIDIHADDPPEPTTQPSRSMITPCVLPASLLLSLASLCPAQSAEPMHDPVTCPICRQNACTLPGGMVASLETLITASFDDPVYDTPKDDASEKDTAQHNHVAQPETSASQGPDKSKDAAMEPTVIIDPDTGKLIFLGSEDDLEEMEDLLDELTEGDAPPVIRQFPLKYEDVNKAAQLLEQIFNQGAAAVGKKGRGAAIPMAPAPAAPQPGKAPVPGQPLQPGQQPQPGQPGQPQQQMQQPAGPSRIKAIPNVRTKSILVVAPPQDIPLVIDVLKTIDQKVPPSNKNIRMFRLQNLEAGQVVQSLREVLGLEPSTRGGNRAGRPGQPGQPQPQEGQPQQQIFQMAGQQGQAGATATVSADEVKLTAEEQTNTVIAQGPTDTLDLIGKLIDDLEKETNTTKPEMRRVALEHARASDIATIVKDVAGQVAGGGGGGEGGRGRGRGGNVSVNADSRTNSVILAGQSKDLERVEKVIKELDVDQEGSGVRQFPVTGDANSIVTALKSIYVGGGRESDIVITADAASGTILVKAPAPQMEEIGRQIQSLEGKAADTQNLKMIRIKVADAETVAKQLEEVFTGAGKKGKGGQPLTIKGNKNNGTVYVANAAPEVFEQIKKVASDMDTQPSGMQVKSFPLKHASAVDVNQKLTDMMTKAMATGGLSGVKLDLVGVVPDARTNSLIVTGGPVTFMLIGDVLRAVDQEADESVRPTTVTYNVPDQAKAAQLATNITEMYKNVDPKTTGVIAPVVSANPDANLVVVTATPKQQAEIKASIVDPILASVTKTNIKVTKFIPLVNGKADAMARALTEAFQSRTIANQQGKYPISIAADMASNSLVVTATEEYIREVEEMMKKVDVEKGRKVFTVAMPDLVPAKTVVENINKLYGSPQGQEGVKAEYHEPTNTLLVFASDAEYAKIKEQVIDVVSKSPAIGAMQMYKIALKHAVADEVAKTLQAFFDKKAGLKNQQSNTPPWMRGGEPPAKAADNQVTITAEPSANMLLVYCSEKTKELIDDIVKDIDVDNAAKMVMEMVPLKYVDASEMIAILTEYLKVAKRSTEEEGPKFMPWWADKELKKDDKTVLAGDMRLKAVETMNAVIVVGKREGVDDTIAKIKELDVERKEGTVDVPTRIALKNGNASDIAGTLNRVFNDPNRTDKSKGATYKAPVIVAEDATNSIIVRATAGDFGQIKGMIESLDLELKEDGTGAVRILPVPAGRGVEELARLIEAQLNDAENNKKLLVKDYKPSMVKIGADTRANALLVSGSKAKYEEAQRLVNELVAMAPTGGTTRRVINLKSMSPQQVKQLLEQIQKGPQSGTTGASNRGARSDAGWTRSRRDERERSSMRTAYGLSLPVLMTQIVLNTAVAQTQLAQAPPKKDVTPPTATIRSRTPSSQPAEPQIDAAQLERMKALAGQGIDPSQMSDSAKEALYKKFSGAPIGVTEAGQDTVVIEANDADMDVVISIIEMLDKVTATKRLEYVTLKNARAQELAKTLTDVFSKVEKKGERQPRPEDKVDIVADPRTNGLYIAATEEKMAQALELIRKNEEAAPSSEKNVKSFQLKNRRVMEAGEILKKMVAAYLKQKGITDPSQIGIELDPQTNTILVTGGETDLQFVEKLVGSLDAELPQTEEGKQQPVGEADVMIIPLRVAQADTLGTLLNELLKKAATGDTPMKDFIRRFRLLDDKGEPLATVNLDRPIVIFGDKDSNSLIIASTKQNCLIMKQVALAFDKEPARAEVVHKMIALKYAESSEVEDRLKKLLTDSEALTQRPGKGDKSGIPDGPAGALVFKAVVSADARTNQILIVARPEELKILEDLVARLDVKGSDVMPFELVRLEYASATGLETALTDMMKARAEILPKGTGPNAGKNETVIIKGDPRSRSLIISANQSRREEIKELIKKLDIPATALIEDIRTITLKKTTATDLAEKLKKLWEQRQQQQSEGSKGLKLETPAIVADERSNSLIVAASKGDFEAIKSVVDKIESLELNPMANIYLVRLKHNSAKTLEPAFTGLFEKRAEMRTVDGKPRPEDKVAIKVDEVTNTLLFVGSRENYDVMMEKIGALDQEIGVQAIVEFFVCTNVGAGRVKDTIDQLFKDGVFKPGVASDSPGTKDRAKVTTTVDERSNIIMVSAAPENMELVREIYKRMNSVTTPWDVAITKLIIIEHGDAVKIAAQVLDYFEKLKKIREEEASSTTKSKGGFGVTVFADERSNRIVLGGTKDGIDSAVELVKKLDVPPGTPGQLVEVYRLTEASAAKVGETVKKIFEERNKPRGGDTGSKVPNIAVSIEVEATTNSLVVNASREDHILVKDLLARLDRPSTVLEMAKVIPLEKASAEKVKKILDELYQSGGSSGSGGTGSSGGGKGIGVIEDKRTNAVVVTAPPGELENIVKLVERLDQSEVKGGAEIGVFPCNNEDAKKMAELLNSILTGETTVSSSSGSSGSRSSSSSGAGGSGKVSDEAREVASMVLSFATTDERGKELFLKTIRENVQITYNERTNSIIAIAPPSSLKLIRQLIKRLDEIQMRSVLVKVFLLRNADATKMVEQLEKMFAQDEGSQSQEEFQQNRSISVEGGTTATGGAPTAASQGGPTSKGTFGRPKSTFVADERTNAIIVAGWPEDIDVVADVIDQLDSRSIQDRENMVIALNNATAEDVEAALTSYFEAETNRLSDLQDFVSPQRRMEQEVSIVPHPESNQLLVSVSPRYKQQVLTLVEQLDRPPPQVMIQVVIAEVSLNDRFEMGLEFALQELRFSETAVANPNGILQSSHFDVVGGTDLGAAGSGLGGFSFTITGEDFNFLVRALQADSRLEVIQRPMIMCQDNQEANISIGQSVPLLQGSVSSGFGGGITSTVQYQDVGVILTVEPHINPDGYVYLLVEPEISNVSDSNVQIAPGSFAPIINRRTASTNVAVRDGETVVIGGLITTAENESESKVPVLGDIPGLGILFRTTTRTKSKTELLIAMTPHVVRTVEDARRISIDKRDESGIITDSQKQSPLFEKLQVKPESVDEWIDTEPTPPEEAFEQPGPHKAEPAKEEGEKKKYGPQAPKYGPLVPPGDDVVARRTTDPSRPPTGVMP
ncbi:MAG: hypothetical protein HZA51_18115 [Planctomycetes bacterium]|nr:hypothetical protein [Planctomycetota bacterium]